MLFLKRRMPAILTVLAFVCGFFLFLYTDITDTFDNAALLVESFVNGKTGSFYHYAADHAARSTVYTANYDLPIYLIFAFWNLPAIFLHLLTGFDYLSSTLALLWCKLLLPLFLLLTLSEILLLSYRLSGDTNRAPFLFFSSLAVFVPLMVASQYDIIEIYFILMGIRAWSCERTWKFLLCFAAAIPLKIFAVFVFIPLLLLRWKNVFKILGMLILGLLPAFLVGLPFSGEPVYEAALASQSHDAVNLLLSSFLYISSAETPIHPFLIAYFVLCLWAYCIKSHSLREQLALAAYFSFAVFGFFCLLTPARSYWMILFTPFLALLAASRREEGALPALMDTVLSASYAIYMLADHWIYNTGELLSSLVMKNVSLPENTVPMFGHFRGLLQAAGLYPYRHVLLSVFAAAFLFSLWYFCPYRRRRLSALRGEEWVRLARSVLLIFIVFVLVFANFMPGAPALIKADEEKTQVSHTGILESAPPALRLAFDADSTVSHASIPVSTPNINRKARSLIALKIEENGVLVRRSEIGIASLGEKREMVFSFEPLPVKKGCKYTFTLVPLPNDDFHYGDVYPALNPDGSLAITLY